MVAQLRKVARGSAAELGDRAELGDENWGWSKFLPFRYSNLGSLGVDQLSLGLVGWLDGWRAKIGQSRAGIKKAGAGGGMHRFLGFIGPLRRSYAPFLSGLSDRHMSVTSHFRGLGHLGWSVESLSPSINQ